MSNDKTHDKADVQANLSSVTVYDPGARPFPLTLTARSVIADAVISPPDPNGGDRSEEDRKRHKDRIKDQIKPKLPELIGGNPIFGDKGKIKVPVSGGYEPRWRYGRDPQGGGGGGSGKDAGSDPADEIFVEIDLDELLQMLFEDMELPDLLKKQLATTKVKAHKYRGIQPTGPKPRLRKGDTARARVRRSIGMRNANPDDPKFAALLADEKKKKIPSTTAVPFHKKDFRYNRVEETLDDESKAVIFFILDRSGSMGGEPLMIAKAFFVLNLMFLRNKYKDVKVVMIAHDAHAFRIEDETKWFQIEAGGGTVALPAYQMVFDIAQAEFPAATWNRYMFQATDGVLFDGDQVIRDWYTKLIKTNFNYLGYLEVGGGWGWGGNSWQAGGQALLSLPGDVMKHVGMARVDNLKQVPDAFKQILDKDKKKS